MSISTPRQRPVTAAVRIMACRSIMVWILMTSFIPTVVVVSAATFSSLTTTTTTDPSNNNNDDDWVSPLLDRHIRTQIVASDWGRTNVPTIWCELYTLLEQYGTTRRRDNDNDDEPEVTWSTFPKDDEEEENAAQRFLHHLTTHHDWYHDRMRNHSHWDPVIREILSLFGTDSTRRLLQYMMSMRTTSPTCELHRTLFAAASITTTTTPIDESDVAVTLIIYPMASTTVRRVDLRHDWNVTLDLVQNVLQGIPPHVVQEPSAPPLSGDHDTTTTTERMDRLVKEHVLPGEVVYQSSQQRPTTTTSSSSNTPTEDQYFVVVYGLLGTRQFAALYPALLELPVTFVVRHRGTTSTKEDIGSPPTILQGYGVRLDIRNVEYKVFDDRRTTLPTTTKSSSDGNTTADDDDESTMVVDENGLYNVSHIFKEQIRHDRSTMIQHHSPILAGVNVTKLWESRRHNQNNNSSSSTRMEFMELQRKLWKIHDTQMVTSQIIPPVWQRRQLPMQVASVVAAAPDPLTTFQHLIQNLPSVASTLVHVKVPEIVVNATTVIGQNLRQSFQPGFVYVNGRIATSLERPTFNVFELLKLIREEQGQLHNIESLIKGGPGASPLINATARSSLLRDIQKAWMMGRKFSQNENDNDENEHNNAIAGRTEKAKKIIRIDVGRGWKKAVLYLNDVEKDAQYEMWPTSLREMLMKMQYGMPPTVRRNIFTILCILDPLQPANEFTNTETMNGGGNGVVENVGYNLGTQLMQAAYPARIGLLLASESDIQHCLQWMSTTNDDDDDDDESCPVSPIFRAPVPTKITELKSIPATTHAIHRMLVTLTVDENTAMGTIFHFCDFLFLSILDEQKDTIEPLSMYQLLLIYGKYIAAMGARSESQGMDDGFQLLLRDESTITSYSYGRSVRFAVDKRLKPGMSFMNGRPLPTDPGDNEAISTVFSEEQSYVFGLMVNGDITDTSPKSIYAKLLSGEGLYKKFHPLLSLKPKSASSSDESNPMELKHDISPTNSFLCTGTDNAGAFPIDANAYFVIDAFFHYHTQSGINLMKMFIKMMKSLPCMLDASSTGVMYRILPSSALASKSIICPIVSNAAHLGISAIEHLLGSITVSHGIDDLEELLNTVDGLSEQVRTTILTSASGDGPCSTIKLKKQKHFSIGNAIAANGHVFPIEGNSVDHDDLELLLRLEIDRAKAVTNLLRPYVPFSNPDSVDLVGKVAVFLMEEENSRSGKRNNVNESIERIASQLESKENPLHFSWNTDEGDESLQVQVTVILDPVSEAAQRFTPLLKVIRDKLKLPLQLLLAPVLVLEGDDKIPITSYYRFVGDPTSMADEASAGATFSNLPTNHLLTLQVDVPEPWNVQQKSAIQDTDNLRCDIRIGCSDDMDSKDSDFAQVYERQHHTKVEYDLKNLLIFGQCYEMTNGSPPNGLQLTLSRSSSRFDRTQLSESVEIGLDGESLQNMVHTRNETEKAIYSDTLVMKNVGYWQLPANPGVWNLGIADGSEGAIMFEIIAGSIKNGALAVSDVITPYSTKKIVMQDFVSRSDVLLVRRRPGYETANLFSSNDQKTLAASADDDVIHVFSLATGHLYERFLKIMMLSVTKRTASKVKFWLFENFLSPTFKASAQAMAKRIGCEVEFVTYKWPEWLRAQSEKQRIIWGYKILFLDVLFPMNVKRIIYVDADQVVRADLKELWDMDLQGHVYGYTPFCTSRNTTLGFQFWREGFWKNHLGDKPYHISALYVVDLELFRRNLVGDVLRSTYQQLSADPNSLANLDQDLPNFAQKQVPIFSLPQEWLWCESWCSDETKATSKTIDLCNNPLHKEPKVSMAKRIISGSLFNESWVELDAEVERYEQEYYSTTTGIGL